MSDRRVRKIKWDGVKASINYEKQNSNGNWDEFSMVCHDQPAPEFKKSLEALRDTVVEILCFDEDYAEGIEVRGVSISYSAEGNAGSVIMCQKKLETANAPFLINTPHLPVEDTTEAGNPCMTEAQGKRLDAIMAAALAYIDGDRSQMELQLSEAKSKAEEFESLVEQAKEIILETQRASTSAIQRRLRIGYTKAATVMEALEERKIIGPPNGSEPRKILVAVGE